MIADEVISIVERESGKSGLTPVSALASLGLDSLEQLELLHQIEQEMHCRISDDAFTDCEDLAGLIRAVEMAKQVRVN